MKKAILFAVSISLVLMLAMSTAADTITFELNFEYSGAFEPEGSPPWLTATFSDENQAPDTVLLTMTAANLTGSEFVSGWYFNVDDEFNAAFLVGDDDYDSGIRAGSISGSNNGLSAGPASGFDFVFNFPTSNKNGGDLRFGIGDKSVYIIQADGLTVASFNFTNEGGNFLSAAHVQGIGPSGENSGWIAATSTTDIPEAASLLSLGLGILGIGLVARKKRLR